MIDVMEVLPTKTELVNKAEKYSKVDGSISFAKGYRTALKDVMPYIQDYFKEKVNRLIK